MSGTIVRGAMNTGDTDVNLLDPDYKKKIYAVQIRGAAMVTAVVKRIRTRAVKTSKFIWTNQPWQPYRGSIVDVFTSTNLSSAYSSGGAVGSALVVQVTAATARLCRKTDVMQIMSESSVDIISAFVTDVVITNDATSYVAIVLAEADSNAMLAGSTLSFQLSNAQGENSQLPLGIYEQPVEYYNHTQIMMDSWNISGTRFAEGERVEPSVDSRMQTQSLNRFNWGMERAMLFGPRLSTVDAQNNPKRLTGGARWALNTYGTNALLDCLNSVDTDYAGKSWFEYGLKMLQNVSEKTGTYSEAKRKLVWIGSKAWMAINELIQDYGMYTISTDTNEFGLVVHRVKGLVNTLEFVEHPLFTECPRFQRTMFVSEPELLEYCPLITEKMNRDIQYVRNGDKNNESGWTWQDGRKEGWFAEAGLGWDNIDAHMWVDNVGLDNVA